MVAPTGLLIDRDQPRRRILAGPCLLYELLDAVVAAWLDARPSLKTLVVAALDTDRLATCCGAEPSDTTPDCPVLLFSCTADGPVRAWPAMALAVAGRRLRPRRPRRPGRPRRSCPGPSRRLGRTRGSGRTRRSGYGGGRLCGRRRCGPAAIAVAAIPPAGEEIASAPARISERRRADAALIRNGRRIHGESQSRA